jgi:hypothetical protein
MCSLEELEEGKEMFESFFDDLKPKKEKTMTNQSWEFYIAGVQHHEAHKVMEELEVGQHLRMVADPDNRFDPNAIRLEHSTEEEGSTMLGYVKGKLSADISAFIEVTGDEQVVKCVITELNPSAKPWEWIKVKIDV